MEDTFSSECVWKMWSALRSLRRGDVTMLTAQRKYQTTWAVKMKTFSFITYVIRPSKKGQVSRVKKKFSQNPQSTEIRYLIEN